MTHAVGQQQWIVFLTTYPPRECGIATFSASLVKALEQTVGPDTKIKVVAINRTATQHYRYPSNVIAEVIESSKAGFIELAKELNAHPNVKAVVVQHEFGIYGKNAGSVLVQFLKHLTKPVLTVLHTVEQKPKPIYKKVLQQVAALSTGLVTMNQTATQLLTQVYKVNAQSIHIIPHGIPRVAPYIQQQEKSKLGLGDRTVLLTFGLLSPDKSIETVIKSLPPIVKQFPDVLYLVLGQTHPNLLVKEGEKYRTSLETLVQKLNLQQHVKFTNDYLQETDIIQYLKAADLYLISSRNPQQIVSGTLAYSLGAGKAIIATPFLHAKELARQHLIELGQFASPASFTKAIRKLLKQPKHRLALEHVAYKASRPMAWDNVALSYYRILIALRALTVVPHTKPRLDRSFPAFKSDHLKRLTDDYGVIQFSHYHIPDVASGYTTDDVARALVVMTMVYHQHRSTASLSYVRLYLNFLERMVRKGKLYNVVDIQRKIDYKHWSEDAQGRAVWSLGYVEGIRTLPKSVRVQAQRILKQIHGSTLHFRFLRATAFSVIGLYWSNQTKELIRRADVLVAAYYNQATADWQWFERKLTYSNSKLPEALLYAYQRTKRAEYLKVAQATLEFLIQETIRDGQFYPIGQRGWYVRGQKRSYFDQQPVEAAAMTHTLMVAYQCTKQTRYLELAKVSYSWFLGVNTLHERLYDDSTGGCFDGLSKRSMNYNQGAESTITYLLARLCFEPKTMLL